MWIMPPLATDLSDLENLIYIINYSVSYLIRASLMVSPTASQTEGGGFEPGQHLKFNLQALRCRTTPLAVGRIEAE